MSAPASSVSSAKREVLQGLAEALAALAGRIQGQGEAAREVGLLTAQAEELAARAWKIACASRADKNAAADLGAAVKSFVEHAMALSQRVAREASTSSALATILRGEAIELKAAGREVDGVNDMKVIRASLRPLLDRLAAVPERLAAMTEIASDVAELGDMAKTMAAHTQGLQESGRNPGIAAVSLYKELRGFADAAGTAASRMWEDEKQIQQTIAQMHEQTNLLASPDAAAAAQRNVTATGRIYDMIVQTKATGLRASSSEPAKPPRGMGWGYAPRPPR